MAASSAPAPSPCAACKLLRRRCTKECVFAPHFPPDEPLKFASVHRVFGASNVNKVLQELPLEHRADAVSSMVYEAHARIRDPVYGCVGAISSLQQQVTQLQTQLALAQAEILYMKMQQAAVLSAAKPVSAAKAEPAPAAPEIHHNHFRSFSFSGFDLPDLGELLWT